MIAAIIIAGGKAMRFKGADKAQIMFQGRPLVEHVIERISKQVDIIAINRSSPLPEYDLPVVPDLSTDKCGPIDGLEAGIAWTRTMKHTPEYLLTVAVDTPFLPNDLVAKLLPTAQHYGAAIASTAAHLQPTISLHKLGHISSADILAFKHKAFRDFWAHIKAKHVCFDEEKAFININCADDIKRYEK